MRNDCVFSWLPHHLLFAKLRPCIAGLAIAATASLMACGGGGDTNSPAAPVTVGPPAATVTANATLLRASTADTAAPMLAFFTRSGGAMSAQKTAAGTQVDVKTSTSNYRSIFDAAGVLKETVDVSTGEKVKVELVAGRVQMLRYSASNVLLGALAVFVQNGVVKVADITGLPTLDGQLTGSVAGSTPASFALVADDFTGLTNIRNADAATLALADNLFPTATSLTASRSVDRQLIANGGDALTAQAFGGVDAAQVTKFALIGFIAGGGLAVAGAASTVVVPVVFAAAAFGILGQVIASQQARLDALFNCTGDVDACKTSSLDIGNSSGMALFGGLAANRSEPDLLQDVVSRSNARWDNLKDNLRRVFDRTKDTVTSAVAATDFSTYPALSLITSQVTGFLVNSANRTANLIGTVDPQGRINVTGTTSSGATSATVALTLTANGTLPGLGQTATSSTTISGTLSGALGSGTVTGKSEAIGACNRIQQAGNQGTFSFAHRLGNGTGTSSFFYDAFSIPDAFTVLYGAGLQYSTGGLVSGSKTTPLVLSGNPTVFVSVSAPNSSTAWNYSLSCPS